MRGKSLFSLAWKNVLIATRLCSSLPFHSGKPIWFVFSYFLFHIFIAIQCAVLCKLLSAWKFNGVVNIYAVGWMPLNAVVNNCWDWTIPVNCAQYGSASFLSDISEWGQLDSACEISKIQFWVYDKTVYKIKEIGLNAIELLGLEHSCQLLVMWFRLLLELVKTGYTDNFGKSQNYWQI